MQTVPIRTSISEEEAERRELAEPEIRFLDDLQQDQLKVDPGTLSAAQLLTWLSERRKLIIDRARLSGAMPVAPQEADNGH